MKKTSIILIDDNEKFLKIASLFLGEYSHLEVMKVIQSPEIGLEIVAEIQPDIVTVDLAMPNMNGLEIIPILKSISPNTKIIALTLYESYQYENAALGLGANAFISKTNMYNKLIPTIERFIRGRNLFEQHSHS